MAHSSYNSVLLLHTLADGSSHFDWLFDTDPDANLLTFRVNSNISRVAVGAHLPATRLADHRRIYLSFEGPLTENRGTVRQVTRARARIVIDPAFIRVEIHWLHSRVPQLWLGTPADPHTPNTPLWRFVSLPLAP